MFLLNTTTMNKQLNLFYTNFKQCFEAAESEQDYNTYMFYLRVIDMSQRFYATFVKSGSVIFDLLEDHIKVRVVVKHSEIQETVIYKDYPVCLLYLSYSWSILNEDLSNLNFNYLNPLEKYCNDKVLHYCNSVYSNVKSGRGLQKCISFDQIVSQGTLF